MIGTILPAADTVPPRLLDPEQFGVVIAGLSLIVCLLGVIAVGVMRRG